MSRYIKLVIASLVLGGTIAAHAEEVTPRQGRSVAVPEAAAAVTWAGFAVAPNGRVFRVEATKEGPARTNAKSECELQIGRTCRAIAVPTSWFVSAISCGGSSFVAGSSENAATLVARRKALDAGLDDSGCREIYSY